MHILVIGGTGQSGLDFIEEALHAGHRLTLYARSPSKFPQNVKDSLNVTIVEGDFQNDDAIKKALNGGAELLVSLAGPGMPAKGTPITGFYQKLSTLLPTHSTIRRCICLATVSYSVPEDKSSIKWFLGVSAVRLLLGSAYDEIRGMSRAIASIPLDKVEWTLFRVPSLTNGEAKPVRAGFVGDGKSDGLFLSRKSIAVWILQEVEERRWIGRAPCLCNPGWL